MRRLFYKQLTAVQMLVTAIILMAATIAIWVLVISPVRNRVQSLEFLVSQQEIQINIARANEADFYRNVSRYATEIMDYMGSSVFEMFSQVAEAAADIQSSRAVVHEISGRRIYEKRIVATYTGEGATDFPANLPPLAAFSIEFGSVLSARAELSVFGR